MSIFFYIYRSSGEKFGFREAIVKDAVMTNQVEASKVEVTEEDLKQDSDSEAESVTMEKNGHVDATYPLQLRSTVRPIYTKQYTEKYVLNGNLCKPGIFCQKFLHIKFNTL